MIGGTPTTLAVNHPNSRTAASSNIYILFVEFENVETDAIITLLREIKLAPRGHVVNNVEEAYQSLKERHWDLIICKAQTSALDPLKLPAQLLLLDKDIPIIQLVDTVTAQAHAAALISGLQAVLCQDNAQVLQLTIQREISQLEQRRKLRNIELQLSQSQKRCVELTNHSALPIIYIQQHKIIYANSAFATLFGYQLVEEAQSKMIDLFVVPQERAGFSKLLSDFTESSNNRQAYQLLCKRVDTSQFTAHIELQHHYVNNQACVQLTIANSDQILNKNKFSDIDPLTGLYNQAYFSDTLENTLLATHNGGTRSHLIYINLLNFQQTRSELGSEASRTLARDVAKGLNEQFNIMHLQARIQESVFTVIYQHNDTALVMQTAEQLLQRLSSSQSSYQDFPLDIRLAIGVVPLSATISSVDDVLRQAEKTSISASELEKPQLPILLYTPQYRDIGQEESDLIIQTRNAVDQCRFKLLFQPIVPLAFSSDEQHYEVLLRMLDEEDNTLKPSQFLSRINNADLNEKMDRWVIENSIKRLCVEQKNNKQPRLFISVTDTLWMNNTLLTWLSTLLCDSRIDADHLVFQISENECSGNLAAAKYFVDGLRQLHCRTCLKHYGSSSDSENTVRLLDPDYVKFDASYTQEIIGDSIADANFNTMLKALEARGKITIAPLVETPKVMSLLWKSGVCMIQGYYLQAPEVHMDYEFF